MSSQHSLTYTRSFLNDVLKIIAYKRDQGHSDASIFYQGVLEKLENLRSYPEIGGKPERYPVFCARGYRYISYGSYYIFYKIKGKTVLCMRLRHVSRQPI